MSVALLLTHAAGFLTAEARGLYVSCSQDGDWNGEPEAKAVHDDMTTTAAGLLALASQITLTNERRIDDLTHRNRHANTHRQHPPTL